MISCNTRLAITFMALLFATTTCALAQHASANKALERGRYLVQRVGMCGDCHTPHDQHGPIAGQELQGSTIPFKPTVPMPVWATSSPAIAGLPQFSNDKAAMTFLTTGKDASGHFARPPMPAYRFNRKDAAAVVAYLRSLSAAKK